MDRRSPTDACTITGVQAGGARDSSNPPASEERAVPPRVVTVASNWVCASSTLPSPAVDQIEAALRAAPWYRDRWSLKAFRRTLAETMRQSAAGGLILVGPRVRLEVPPPFEHLFEPIQIGAGDERFKTLSGEKPTRQERMNRIAVWILAPVGLAVLMTLGFILWIGAPRRIAAMIFAIATGAALLAFVARHTVDIFKTWYVLPGSIAIVRRFRRRRERLTILSRFNACAILRYVHAGKVVLLMLELITLDGRREAIAVTEREAISVLAAWQSPHPPPTPAQLRELILP